MSVLPGSTEWVLIASADISNYCMDRYSEGRLHVQSPTGEFLVGKMAGAYGQLRAR
jgi:hypothetical protein